jgi:acetyl-CoA acetyltransferase
VALWKAAYEQSRASAPAFEDTAGVSISSPAGRRGLPPSINVFDMQSRREEKMQERPAIAAAAEIRPQRYPDASAQDLYSMVIEKLFDEYDLKPGDIDGVLAPPLRMTTDSPNIYNHEKLAIDLGISPRLSATINAGGATYGLMVQYAALAIAAGKADAVLCIAAGEFPKMDAKAIERVMRFCCDPSFEVPYGPAIPALYAQYATRYMHEFGITSRDLAAVSITARKWALRNPDAITHEKGEITIEDVIASQMIASPFHYLDCSIPTAGGGAVLVTSAARAKRITRQPAYILGTGEYHGYGYVSQNPDLTQCGAGLAAREAFRQSGLTPREIDHAQLYDAFTICPIMLLEDIGFAERGAAPELFHSGAAAPGGVFPINTYGGLIAYGHTGDASGMSMIVEGARQVMGRARNPQVKSDNVLIHVYGGMMSEHCTLILGRNL